MEKNICMVSNQALFGLVNLKHPPLQNASSDLTYAAIKDALHKKSRCFKDVCTMVTFGMQRQQHGTYFFVFS